MVLLHQIVQVRAGSNLAATQKFAICLHLSHRPVRGRISVQRDLRGDARVLHRAAQKRFGGVHVPVRAEKEIDACAACGSRDGPSGAHRVNRNVGGTFNFAIANATPVPPVIPSCDGGAIRTLPMVVRAFRGLPAPEESIRWSKLFTKPCSPKTCYTPSARCARVPSSPSPRS